MHLFTANSINNGDKAINNNYKNNVYGIILTKMSK